MIVKISLTTDGQIILEHKNAVKINEKGSGEVKIFPR